MLTTDTVSDPVSYSSHCVGRKQVVREVVYSLCQPTNDLHIESQHHLSNVFLLLLLMAYCCIVEAHGCDTFLVWLSPFEKVF